MSISLETGFSVSVPLIITDGPLPTVGVVNPARSVRIDALGGTGANVSYTCDGHNGAVLVNVTPPVNRGVASFGTPGVPFPTPAP